MKSQKNPSPLWVTIDSKKNMPQLLFRPEQVRLWVMENVYRKKSEYKWRVRMELCTKQGGSQDPKDFLSTERADDNLARVMSVTMSEAHRKLMILTELWERKK